jgi:hypothetical protein
MAFGQEINKELKHFTRVIASPRINVILNEGDREAIRVVYHDITKNKINIEVKGKTLRLYLDDARKVEPMRSHGKHGRKESIYEGVSVTAYITYKELSLLEIRGRQELTCLDPIESDAFTLRAYGENEINFASVRTGYFKAKLYGENELDIKKGRSIEQKYTLYGENKINTKGFRSEYIVTSIFGEGSLNVYSSEEVRIDAFGEPNIHVDGGGNINRRMVIGNASITND